MYGINGKRSSCHSPIFSIGSALTFYPFFLYSSSPFHNPTVLYESRFENLLRIIPFTRYTSRQTGTNIDKLLVRGNTSHVTTVAVLMCRMDL